MFFSSTLSADLVKLTDVVGRLSNQVLKMREDLDYLGLTYVGKSPTITKREFYDEIGRRADTPNLKINNVVSDRVLSQAFTYLGSLPPDKLVPLLRELLK